MKRVGLSILVSLAASLTSMSCAVGADPGSSTSFGPGGTSFSSTDATMDGPETGSGDASTEGGDGDGDGDGETSDATGSTDTGSTDTGSTDTGSTDTGSTDTGSTDTTGTTGGGGQPDEGMYAMCIDPGDCVNVNTCITLGDPPTDGICSTDCKGANDPSNCDPAPNDATATPTCMVFDNGQGGWRYLCALACDNGKTCPAGMQCTNVMDGMNAKLICF